MPPDRTTSSRFADLWSMLHEGGLVIETRTTTDDRSPVALRTLLQLDGDRIVWICRNAIGPMSHYQRLRVAVRHRRSVRQHSVQRLYDASRWVPWLRYGCLGLFGAGETSGVVVDWPFVHPDWKVLLLHQAPSLVLLAASFVAPKALRFAVPRILRWYAAGSIRQRAAERRQASKKYVCSVRGTAPP